MTSDSFNDIPGPRPSQIEDAEPADVAGAEEVALPEPFPDREAEHLLEEAADDARATATEMMEEDVPLNDVMHDVYPEDIEREPLGVREFHTDIADPGQSDSIEERILQEEPEPDHDVVSRDADLPDPDEQLADPEVPLTDPDEPLTDPDEPLTGPEESTGQEEPS